MAKKIMTDACFVYADGSVKETQVEWHPTADPHAICAKWVKFLGGGFHPDTRGADYLPRMGEDDVAEYDADMKALFASATDPYECAVMAMADAGYC